MIVARGLGRSVGAQVLVAFGLGRQVADVMRGLGHRAKTVEEEVGVNIKAQNEMIMMVAMAALMSGALR